MYYKLLLYNIENPTVVISPNIAKLNVGPAIQCKLIKFVTHNYRQST